MKFTFGNFKKSYYTDKHEDFENIKARNEFTKWYLEAELRAYRWIQITKAEAEKLEKHEKNPLDIGSYRREYKNNNGIMCREYHVDVHKSFINYILPEIGKVYGGNRSINFPKGSKPLLILGQDESTFYQFSFGSRCWTGPNGERKLRPKSNGYAIMVSGFASQEVGFGFCPTDDEMKKINNNRQGKYYITN